MSQIMDTEFYRQLLVITEEIEALLGRQGYDDERLAPLLARRRDLFNRLGEVPLEYKYAVLIKRIRATEDKCMALAQDRLNEIQAELLTMHKGKQAMAAYARQG